MKRLLIVYHTQFGGTAQMAEAAARGARQIDDVETIVKRAADAGTDDLLDCDCADHRDVGEFRLALRHGQGLSRARVLPVRGQGRGQALYRARLREQRRRRRDAADRSHCHGASIAQGPSGTIYRSGLIAQAHQVPDATPRHLRRDRRDPRGRTIDRHLLTSAADVVGVPVEPVPQMQDQDFAGPLDEVEHPHKVGRSAEVGIGYLGDTELGGELEEQAEMAGKIPRPQRLERASGWPDPSPGSSRSARNPSGAPAAPAAR